MKKLLLLWLAVFMVFLSQAQIKKGDIVLGGNFNYYSQSAGGTTIGKNTTLNINPSIGKAIRDNLVMGLDIAYGHTSYKPDASINNTTNNIQAGLFLRRYKPLGNGFYLFGQGEVSGSFAHNKNNNPEPGNDNTGLHSNSYGFALQLYPGIAYAINRKWQVETGLPNFLSISYSHTKSATTYLTSPDDPYSTSTFQISSALSGSNQFSVGVRYFIGS